VVRLSDVDPFALAESDDSSLWKLTDDVFSDQDPGAETESAAAEELEAEAADAAPLEEAPPPEELPTEELLEPDAELTGPEDVTPPLGTVAPPPVTPIEVPAREAPPPLPTITLARLAVEQGEFRLAETTLQALLDRDPDHSEAAELLDRMRSGGLGGRLGRTAAKVAALQAWLDTIRLASERRTL
jgi:hypothetical protein